MKTSKTKISKTVQDFLDYSFKGDAKYYLYSQGSRHYRNTDFSNFARFNSDCFTIVEEGNDAPRGGALGSFVVVKFNEKFKERFGFYFEERKKAEEEAKKAQAEKLKLIEGTTEKFKAYVKNHPEKIPVWLAELEKRSHKEGRLYKTNRVNRATGVFLWWNYRIFDEVVLNK